MQIPKSGSRNKKKVLIISQYFWPENFRINEIVKFLRSKNYYVTVITGLPNYPDGKLFKEFSQNTEYFSKYCGAEIIRVPIILRERSTKINLFLNYLSFNFSSIFFSFLKIRKRKYDIIFTFGTSPVTVSLTSIFYRNYFKAKHVLWLLDVWPEIIFELKILKNKILFYFLKRIVNFIYSRTDLILAQSKSFVEIVKSEIYKNDISKIKFFPSWSELPLVKLKKKKPILDKNFFNILFAGNLGEAQNFPLIVDVFHKLRYNKNIRLTILGSGRNEFETKLIVKKYNLSNIFFIPQVQLHEVSSYLDSADALLISLKSGRTISSTIPGKLQTYLSTGKPIIGLIDGEVKDIIKNYNLGFATNSTNLDFICKNILNIVNLDNRSKYIIRKNSFKLLNTIFNKKKIFEQLLNYFKQVVNQKPITTIRLLNSFDLSTINKNFILSGLNLAFIGTLAKKELYIHKNMYHWPDGLFQRRFFNRRVKKISGRSLINLMKVPKKIKKIYILGNSSSRQVNFIKNKFKKKVTHIKLPYSESVYEIYKYNLATKIFKDSDLIFVTLPTPKQEHLAFLLAQNNNYKIICIGGALSMIVGEEKSIPYYLESILGAEAIWRLKTDTIRRSQRLFSTLFYYVVGELFNIYKNIKGKLVNVQRS